METWKENTKKMLSKNGIYNVGKLNDQLYSWIKEWRKLLSEDGGLHIESEQVYKCFNLNISYQNKKPFILNLYFIQEENEIFLEIEYTKSFSWKLYVSNLDNENKNKLSDYEVVKEKLYKHEEIFEIDFVLNYLTKLLEGFLTSYPE